MYHMEGLFALPIAVRTEFIHSLMQSLGGCCYICLWAYNTILPKYIIYLYAYIHLPTLLYSKVFCNIIVMVVDCA
jgi:hypothetical protein